MSNKVKKALVKIKRYLRGDNFPEYSHPGSAMFGFENGWIEIKPFTKKDRVTFVLYSYKDPSDKSRPNSRTRYNRFYVELESPLEVRDFLEWFTGPSTSLLYGSIRAYLEISADDNRFIQITHYGYNATSTWQWSSIISSDIALKVIDHIKSNWTQVPFVEPSRKSIHLGNGSPHSLTKDSIPLTYNI